MDGFLLHLQGPMMSFADKGFGQLREEGEFPSRSAVIGIVAAALGLERGSERLLELHRSLRVHVASLSRGSLLVDYHTVLASGYGEYDPAGIRREGGGGNPTLTWRSYHTDAHFMAYLQSDNTELMRECREALAAPVFTAFIGRRSCPPATPILPVEITGRHIGEAFLEGYQKWMARIGGKESRLPYHIQRRLPEDHLDVWIDGQDAPEGIEIFRHSSRRDLLTALPRSYVNRPVVQGRILLPQQLLSTTNEEYYNAAF